MSNMELKGKQKAVLKKLAHDMKPIFHVGKGMVTEKLATGVSEALEKRELIKVNLLQNCIADAKDIAYELSEATGSEVIAVIGRTIILYRKNQDDPKIMI